ncbi:MAG: DUF3379 family protein [Pseudomonadota bacterium]
MDCNELKQKIYADPYAVTEAELAECEDCRVLLDEVRATDAQLKQAMSIGVPPLKMPELPAIDTDNVVGLPTRRAKKAPMWLATAAAVTLAAFLGINTFTGHDHSHDDATLAAQIIEHMAHEPYALKVTDVPVSDRRLNRIVPATVADVSHDAGLITYAESCEINGNLVPHLVIQGENGPVTIILLPDEKVESATPLDGGGFKGLLVPVGEGSIAILGEESPESMQRIRESFTSSANWST